MSQLYGLCGRKQHGKNTLSSYICAADHNVIEYAFADALKTICSNVFGIPLHELHDNALKEAPLPYPIAIDDYLCAARAITQLPLEAKGLVATSRRDLMQKFGTEYVRGADPEYWTDTTASDIDAGAISGNDQVVTDVRFANEPRVFRKRRGRLIKIVRGALLSKHRDNHASEAGVDSIEADLLLVSHNDKKALLERVGTLIGLGYWRAALEHDYGIAVNLLTWLELYGAQFDAWTVMPEAAKRMGISLGTAIFLVGYYSAEAPYSLQEVTPHVRTGYVFYRAAWRGLIATDAGITPTLPWEPPHADLCRTTRAALRLGFDKKAWHYVSEYAFKTCLERYPPDTIDAHP